MRQVIKDYVYTDLPQKSIENKTKLADVGVTCAIMAVTVLFTELLRIARIEPQNLMMVYILAVFVVSRKTAGYGCGIAAALFATFAYDFLITEPRMGFSISRGAPITLFTMLVVTFITSTLTIQMKTQARLAREKENRAKLLHEITQELLVARDVETIIQVTVQYLLSHLGRPVIFYSQDPYRGECDASTHVAGDEEGLRVFFTEAERKRVHRIFLSGGIDPAGVFDDENPQVHYEPVSSKGTLLGIIGVSCVGQPLNQNNLVLLKVLKGQVALSLELQYLSDEQSRVIVDSEKEKLRSTLLRAISHDLRTPLTSILGASSTILDQEDMDRPTLVSLVGDIQDNTQWLIRMVENVLAITKISRDTMRVSKTMEAAEEVIAQSVEIVRKRFSDWQIHVHVPEEVIMAPMDATLISQVIINLIENAVKNSPSGSLILVSLKKQEEWARFDICDNGWGIPEEVLENLFEVHSPSKERFMDAVRGIGIGLSICQAIIQAHGGIIEGANRKEGGARFTFLLPLEDRACGDNKEPEAQPGE